MVIFCIAEKVWLLEEKEFEDENKFKVGKVEEPGVKDFTVASTNVNLTLGVLD